MSSKKSQMISWALVLLSTAGATFWGVSLISTNAQETDWTHLSCVIKPGKIINYSYSRNLNAVDIDGELVRDAVFQNRQIIFDAQLQDGVIYHHILNLEDRTLRIQTKNRHRTMPLIKCNLATTADPPSKIHRHAPRD